MLTVAAASPPPPDHAALPDPAPATGPRAAVAAVARALQARLVGQERLIERLLVGVLAGGHVLVEGAPGLAKTRAVRELARGLDVSFARVQCTPDLLPADLTGTMVWRPDLGAFAFVAGPLFHALVLVDEVNRAPPKLQSALLEAMGEGQVTVAGVTRRLPEPFVVVATQNPIEHEGTYPLPEAQLDRFLLQVVLPLPGEADERAILDLVEAERRAGEGAAPHGPAPASPAPSGLTAPDIAAARRLVEAVHLAPALKTSIVALVMGTRDARGGVRDLVLHPVSPRGTLGLAAAAKARAFLNGRDFVTPDDVADLAPDVLAHRLVLTWGALGAGETARGLVARLLDRLPPG